MNIFLDFDGTVVDNAERFYRVHIASLRNTKSSSYMPKEVYWKMKKEGAKEKFILDRYYRNENLQEYEKTRASLLENPKFLTLDTLLPGVKDTLHMLSEGFDVYLVTLRRIPQNLQQEIDRLGIRQCFKEIRTTPPNPTPEAAKKSLMEAESEGAWIIGDTEADILAGKELHMKTCAVLTGIRTEAFLRDLNPDYVLNSVADLPSVLAS